jgi:hypothetical protein
MVTESNCMLKCLRKSNKKKAKNNLIKKKKNHFSIDHIIFKRKIQKQKNDRKQIARFKTEIKNLKKQVSNGQF